MTSTDNARAALLGTDTEEGALDLDRPAGDGTPYSEGIVEGYSQAVNVVRATLDRLAAGRAETTTDDCPECGDNYCRCGIDWTADPRAETTTATTEDIHALDARWFERWETEQPLADKHAGYYQGRVSAIAQCREELRGLLATARTVRVHPTYTIEYQQKIADELGVGREGVLRALCLAAPLLNNEGD